MTSAFRAFLQDLEALPEAAFDKAISESTRPVADIVYEVILFNDHIGHHLRGERPFDWPEYDLPVPEEARNKQAVISAFRTSSERILATVKAMSAEDLEVPIPIEAGQEPYQIAWAYPGEATRFGRCQFMTAHAWYHDGQLNYIQALLGDGHCHWN
ncbi:MAG: DinB family protein [Armatimonas sp.]